MADEDLPKRHVPTTSHRAPSEPQRREVAYFIAMKMASGNAMLYGPSPRVLTLLEKEGQDDEVIMRRNADSTEEVLYTWDRVAWVLVE